MTLLRDIQKSCTSTETHVADLLRKCKILAVHLKSSSFDQWVDRELNGYKNKEELPDYRKLTQLHSLGNFTVHRITWWRVSSAQRKPPEVRICRLSIQSCGGKRPPSTSTP